MGKGFSFGVVRSEQTRLRGFGDTAGTVCLGQFPADAVAVKSGFLHQGECVGHKTKLVLRYWQTVGAFCSHGIKRKNQVRGARHGLGCPKLHGQALRF